MLSGLGGELVGGLIDLVLPAACAGCGADRVPLRSGACADCAAALEALIPFSTEPVPPPTGMPPCSAVGTYAGPLRSALLAYKERAGIDWPGRWVHCWRRPWRTRRSGAAAARPYRW
jgi:predicted amidophosphoribosyltransferase